MIKENSCNLNITDNPDLRYLEQIIIDSAVINMDARENRVNTNNGSPESQLPAITTEISAIIRKIFNNNATSCLFKILKI
jgi:hypothetical protein